MTKKELDDERKGNDGRKAWNARPQAALEAQQMLGRAIRTIDRLLDAVPEALDVDQLAELIVQKIMSTPVTDAGRIVVENVVVHRGSDTPVRGRDL